MTITQQAGLPLLQGLKIITEQLTHSLYQRASTDIAHITQGNHLAHLCDIILYSRQSVIN